MLIQHIAICIPRSERKTVAKSLSCDLVPAIAAQPAHAPDAAARPQDRADFESCIQSNSFPDLSVAARVMGKALGGLFKSLP